MKAADPALLYAGPSLWVAYRARRTDNDGAFAVVQFTGVEEHRVGPPSDERNAEHPLHGRGLEPLAFHVVLAGMTDPFDPRRWVVTFRAETLDVTAAFAQVVARGVEARSAWDALRAVVPDGI